MDIRKITEKTNKIAMMEMLEIQLEIDNFKGSLIIKDSTQQSIMESYESKYIVNGPAGSGKTILAMIKMLELEKSGSDYKVIIFTTSLASFLRGRMKKANFLNVENKVYHLHSDDLQKIKSDKYDYILIDEIQDFTYNDLYNILDNSKNGYYLYGDENQHIYPKKTNGVNIISEVISKLEISNFNLRKIYRFDKTIFNFANAINPNKREVIPRNNEEDSKLIPCDTPKIIEFNSREDELNSILEVLKTTNWKSVAILLPNNPLVEEVYKWFKYSKNYDKIESKYYYNYDENLCRYKDKHDNLDFSSDNVKILTYHSSKGLEFDRVFVPICSVYEEDNKKIYNYREALYVAFTRAKITLVVSYNHENGKSKYLNEISEDLYLFERS